MLIDPVRRCRRLVDDEGGSTLLMYPFAILIVFALGAIAIDGAVLFQAHRQAVDVASGLASDISSLVDEQAFADDGTIRIDISRAADVLAFANEVELAGHPNRLWCEADVRSASVAVEVTCTGTGQALLLPIGGSDGGLRFSATSRAVPDERS